ncbi:MAG TPA: glycosyltransferase [Acidobacteriota bacterium]|nr:glycosyltransferase [Acidobacteriota bacterium]
MVSALVTLATADYLEQAKQFFSSVFHNGAWEGECVLLAHEISSANVSWFLQHGITVIHCQSLFTGAPGGMHASLTSKFYLFGPQFQKYDVVVYVDADTTVLGNLNHLKTIQKFGAVRDYLDTLGNQFISVLSLDSRSISFNEFQRLKQEIMVNNSESQVVFNAGMFVFRPSKIPRDTMQKLIDAMNKYSVISAFGDQLAFHIVFKEWENVSPLYNMYVIDETNKYGLSRKKLRAIILHFTGRIKPWNKQNYYTKLWNFYYKKSEEINMHACTLKETWTSADILKYDIYLRRIKIRTYIQTGLRILDSKIGQVGILVKKYSPRTYLILRQIMDANPFRT